MRPMALAHLTKLQRLQGSEPQLFLVDNGFLKALTDGLGLRRSKRLEDLLPNCLAPWNTTVQGIDEGDGWLRLSAPGASQVSYLPFFVKGIPVLSLVPRSNRSSPRSSGRPPSPVPVQVPQAALSPVKSWTPMIASQAVR